MAKNDPAGVLDDITRFVRRFVVVGESEVDAIALWVAHTYVYMAAPATPYLHFYSPEPGSGKTTALDVVSVLVHKAIQADDLTQAVLFRMIDSERPTLLFDEIDAVFGKQHSDSTEGIRQVLNSGYRRGKQAWRCVPPSHEVRAFDVYGPKALSGLNKLPGTLAHRSIPIAMKPPLPSDVYEDFDPEDVEVDADNIRQALAWWAENAPADLGDPRLKPAKLYGLDARANEIWRILFRIADLAGREWADRARTAAVTLSGTSRRHEDSSAGVKLLGHVEDVFTDDRMFCGALVAALNALDDAPYGGWNGGAGMTTRELGKKLSVYDVKANTIRIGESKANGYQRTQLEASWSRYLHSNRDTGTTRIVEPKTAEVKPGQDGDVPVSKQQEIRVSMPVVPVVPVSRPVIGDNGYAELLYAAHEAGHLTQLELGQRLMLHADIGLALVSGAGPDPDRSPADEFVAGLLESR